MDNNCHIPDLLQAFIYLESGGLNRLYSNLCEKIIYFGVKSR